MRNSVMLLDRLTQWENRIVMKSTVPCPDRVHAIEEIRYYKTVLKDSQSLTKEDRELVEEQIETLIEELATWY